MISLASVAASPAAIMFIAALLEALLPWPTRLRLSALVPALTRLGHKVRRPDGAPKVQIRSGLLALLVVWLPCAALLWSLRNLTLDEPLFDLLILLLLIESRPLYELARANRQLANEQTLPVARLQAAPWLKRECNRLSLLGLNKALTEGCALRLLGQWAGPLLGFALFGVQGALLWRLAALLNQAFSPKTPAFAHFGLPASRLYQALAALPALLLTLPLLLRRGARRTMRQGLYWPFPTAGLLLASLAGALGIRLGGPRFYAGEKVRLPPLEGGSEPHADAPWRALTLLHLIGALALLVGVLVSLGGTLG